MLQLPQGTGFERVIKPAELGQNSSSSTSSGVCIIVMNSSRVVRGRGNGTAAAGGPSVALSIPSGASIEGNPSYLA